jgi:hypothetical protein
MASGTKIYFLNEVSLYEPSSEKMTRKWNTRAEALA